MIIVVQGVPDASKQVHKQHLWVHAPKSREAIATSSSSVVGAHGIVQLRIKASETPFQAAFCTGSAIQKHRAAVLCAHEGLYSCSKVLHHWLLCV